MKATDVVRAKALEYRERRYISVCRRCSTLSNKLYKFHAWCRLLDWTTTAAALGFKNMGNGHLKPPTTHTRPSFPVNPTWLTSLLMPPHCNPQGHYSLICTSMKFLTYTQPSTVGQHERPQTATTNPMNGPNKARQALPQMHGESRRRQRETNAMLVCAHAVLLQFTTGVAPHISWPFHMPC